MRDLAKFLSFFDRDFRSLFGTFVIAAATTIILQCGLFCLIELLFPSAVMEIDAALGLVMVAPLLIAAVFTGYKGKWDIMFSSLAVIGTYICVVFYFHWGVLIGCIVLLLSGLVRLDKIGVDPVWIYGTSGTYLLYCIGAYFAAMLTNSFEPAINVYGIIVLSVATVLVWLKSEIE